MWVWVLKLLSTSRDSSGTDGWTLRTCKSTDHHPAQGHSEGRTTSSTVFTPADMDEAAPPEPPEADLLREVGTGRRSWRQVLINTRVLITGTHSSWGAGAFHTQEAAVM